MTAAVLVIAEQGGEQVAWASLAVIAWIAAVGAAAAAGALAWRLARRFRVTRLVAAGPCAWCDDRGCIDSTLCACRVPCGRGYCKAPDNAALFARAAGEENDD